MINEQQQELASLFAVGALTTEERAQFEHDLAANPELHAFVRDLQRTAELLAISSTKPPAHLKGKVLARIDALEAAKRPNPNPALTALAGLRFEGGASQEGWKALPVAGAYIKLLSLDQEHGYAVLMGKLDPGTRYPAHINVGPEDFCILTGDLVIGDRRMVAGDFHHADKGSQHAENYSVEGCTLVAVLTADHPLVALAMA
jgi:anti-sigma factor ChrR (cupin superfamily)